ncbi:hypothetical protein MMC25_005953 [Agyrium rufum]|nr:hypothetical protein [Agyrium rufum]
MISYGSSDIRIDTDLLIPGRGDPISNGSIVVRDRKITYAGVTSDLDADHANLTLIKVPVLMPGMWDCHIHLTGTSKFTVDDRANTPPALAGVRLARDVVATLNAGFTSVRETAGYGTELIKAINEGWLAGPNIYSAASILSQTAGHGDAHSIPLDEVQNKIQHGSGLPLHICDGVDQCIRAVRVQVRQGAKMIKVTATGGVASLIDIPHDQQFSDAELKAIVEEAGRCDRVVAAHCHGKRGIMSALRAGCHTIEHGSYLDEEAIEIMLKQGTILAATRSTFEWLMKNPEAWSEEMYAQLAALVDSHKKAYAIAVKAGVKIALGTDLAISSPTTLWNHGMNGDEFRRAVNAGLSPLQAIEAGTANGPETLGLQAPLSGQLKAGYDAEFIVWLRILWTTSLCWQSRRKCSASGKEASSIRMGSLSGSYIERSFIHQSSFFVVCNRKRREPSFCDRYASRSIARQFSDFFAAS